MNHSENQNIECWRVWVVLTLFPLGGGGLFDPLYHESVCCIYKTRTRFTKIHDFVPFGICQDPVKLLLKFFSKKFEILDVKIFWGSSSIRKKWKNFEKFFFEKNPKIWILMVKGSHKKNLSKIGDKIFFSFQRGDPLVFFRFSMSWYTGSDPLWRTEM